MAQLNVIGIASLEECFADAEVEVAANNCAASGLESLGDLLKSDEYLSSEEGWPIVEAGFKDVVGCLANCVEFNCENDAEDLALANPELSVISSCAEPVSECVAAINPARATKAWTSLGLLTAVSAMALNLK